MQIHKDNSYSISTMTFGGFTLGMLFNSEFSWGNVILGLLVTILCAFTAYDWFKKTHKSFDETLLAFIPATIIGVIVFIITLNTK
jgi:ABC-type Mn2+/Zn2+ transport system permease subunit